MSHGVTQEYSSFSILSEVMPCCACDKEIEDVDEEIEGTEIEEAGDKRIELEEREVVGDSADIEDDEDEDGGGGGDEDEG